MPDSDRPRLLIEDWLPAAAIGVECMRERSTGQQPPDKRLHVWWARRPLVASRAAVLGSVLPADFPRDQFERLLGFWGTSKQIVAAQKMLERSSAAGGKRIANPHGPRAFRAVMREGDLAAAHAAAKRMFGDDIALIDPMSGGGAIPLESARLGFKTYANELNPVACTVLETTVDYPFRFGPELSGKALHWGAELRRRFNARMEKFFPKKGVLPAHCYLFARTVPCPDTQHHTPLMPNWDLVRPKGSDYRLVAEPVVDSKAGTWTVRIREVGKHAGQLKEPPLPTSGGGDGISLFTRTKIPSAYIKAQAQNGQMGSALYAVIVKNGSKLEFQPPSHADLAALAAAEKELLRVRKDWEANGIIPTERIPVGDKTGEPLQRGITNWADCFSARQLLGLGVFVEELKLLRNEILSAEGAETGNAVVQLLACGVSKLSNYNSVLSIWHALRSCMANTFNKHDFAFKTTFAEMAVCNTGGGLQWAIESTIGAYEDIAKLPHAPESAITLTQGSAANLGHLDDRSISAIVIDPPYADNVQYSELADYFYVWLKRTIGIQHPDWFSTYLCENSEEAVVNVTRHREKKDEAKTARAKAHAFYQGVMTAAFRESHRVLRSQGALTVMFTHKKQEAWEALFSSLIAAGFTITATWPVKTESEHSLHQAKKNAAQSTVILVSRKRPANAGTGYWDEELRSEIRQKARATAERLKTEGLNAVDQLVGSFGPAMEVYSRYDTVKTDTGEIIGVGEAIDEASRAVSDWRVEQLAEKGLDGVEAEGKFALLCWDVLEAAEFRFNEATLLGKAVGMDVDSLIAAGLVTKSGDKIKVVPVKERRRDRALEPEEVDLVGAPMAGKRRKKSDVLKIHPNDPSFRTALDACHALALRYMDAEGGAGGIGNARELMRRQNWQKGSSVARLLEALVHAAPEAVRHDDGKKTSAASMFPEFRAWHALLQPLFAVEAPDWTPVTEPQAELEFLASQQGELEEMEDEADKGEEESDDS
jgi:putative DNA methylase